VSAGKPPNRLLSALRARLGGPERTRVIVLLACVLALETADLASMGAIAGQLKSALHLHNTELGVLAAAPALIAAVATLPFGVVADRAPRVPLLAISTAVWAGAMLLTAASSSFGMMIVVRLFLGACTAAAAPLISSLVGDLFSPQERGRVYGYILAGQLLGSGFGLLVAGNVAAISWRLALCVLAVPSLALGFAIWRMLPEPARGPAGRLRATSRRSRSSPDGEAGGHRDPKLARAARGADVEPRAALVLHRDPVSMPLRSAVVYVLRLPTNVMLISASALGYFFQAGVNTFGVVFLIAHFGVSQNAATSLLGLVLLGALVGTILGGRIADALLARGHLPARMAVGGSAFLISSAVFVPGLLTHDLLLSIVLYIVAATALAAPGAPLDAARLDIIPSRLRGRAESVRTVIRTLAVAAAPLAFGWVSDELATGPRTTTRGLGYHASGPGLDYAFLLMLIPMAVGGLILLLGMRAYSRDVVTALASEATIERSHRRTAGGHQRPSTESTRSFQTSAQPS
jgi:MFS family permease